MDTIYLKGLTLKCTIGVWQWEQAIKQTLKLDIELSTDASKAAQDDDLEQALDYQKVAERMQMVANEAPVKLLETLATRLANVLLDEFETTRVKLTLDKGQAVKGVKNVGIIIERSRD
ncbi:dihydroneopterin aldolase [Arenicella xantha]|uniref:7,8-dihydroneopterin aldolase n=1 Tax=Arenicella xantha TaxID=644221 RepID=A0A395JEP0_9GAMM|nr:dihydroneopterin aldolase [Arenicella xantha]RBP47073.1 dihydroneopterin aldolase [Arenicella xantha]